MQFIKERVSWAIMAAFALLLIIMGIEGSLGKVLGCLMTPAEVVINQE